MILAIVTLKVAMKKSSLKSLQGGWQVGCET